MSIIQNIVNDYKKKGIVGKLLIIFIGLMMICCCFGGISQLFNKSKDDVSTTPSASNNLTDTPIVETEIIKTSTYTPEITSTPINTLDPSDQMKLYIEDALTKSNRDVERIPYFYWNPDSQKFIITIAANDNLTEDMLKRGIQLDIVKTLRTINENSELLPYDSVFITISFLMVDVYGNEEEQNIVIATYLRSDIEKINWDNFLTDNIYLLADTDSFYIHPAAVP